MRRDAAKRHKETPLRKERGFCVSWKPVGPALLGQEPPAYYLAGVGHHREGRRVDAPGGQAHLYCVGAVAYDEQDCPLLTGIHAGGVVAGHSPVEDVHCVRGYLVRLVGDDGERLARVERIYDAVHQEALGEETQHRVEPGLDAVYEEIAHGDEDVANEQRGAHVEAGVLLQDECYYVRAAG